MYGIASSGGINLCIFLSAIVVGVIQNADDSLGAARLSDTQVKISEHKESDPESSNLKNFRFKRMTTVDSYPRILQISKLWNRTNLNSTFGFNLKGSLCSRFDLSAQVACFAMHPSQRTAESINSAIDNFKIKPCTAGGNRGNAWVVAIFLDQIAAYINLYSDNSDRIFLRISDALEQCLSVLDGDSASLWHGRFSMGAEAFIAALVLPESKKYQKQKDRALKHFLNSIEAIRLTEGWPGGYGYWINNRALSFFIAVNGYLNGLKHRPLEIDLINLVERVGLWHIYMTRPDHRISAIGDDGPRTDLKDETRKVIDLIAKITGNPIFSVYAQYIQNLHGYASYYPSYRWLIPLVYDPRLKAIPDPGKSLSLFDGVLPNAEVFGKNAYNQVVIRSGWGDRDTFIQFRAGNIFTHHQHYDAGHFTVFKNEAVLPDSSVYFGTHTENRLYYSVRTIAKNSLLIHRPGDEIKPNHLFKVNLNDGGQRLVMPTGSAITSVDHWRRNLADGLHLGAGRLQQSSINHEKDEYHFRLDLTKAYDYPGYDTQNKGGKVKSVIRDIIYVKSLDSLIVHDMVWPVGFSFRITSLLHMIHEPQIELREANYARIEISSTEDKRLATIHHLSSEMLTVNSIGGKNKMYWVEDENMPERGRNFSGGAQIKWWNDNPAWRLEFSAKAGSSTELVEFVSVINLGKKFSKKPSLIKNADGLLTGVMLDNRKILTDFKN